MQFWQKLKSFLKPTKRKIIITVLLYLLIPFPIYITDPECIKSLIRKKRSPKECLHEWVYGFTEDWLMADYPNLVWKLRLPRLYVWEKGTFPSIGLGIGTILILLGGWELEALIHETIYVLWLFYLLYIPICYILSCFITNLLKRLVLILSRGLG